MALKSDTELNKVKKKHPSLCFRCDLARKPASLDNLKRGYVGCALRGITNMKHPDGYDHDEIEEAEIVAEGWVDLKTRPTLSGDGSGIISNLQIITKGVKSCKQFKPYYNG